MPNDPGLAGDTCIFMEAITGDGGVHDPNNVWWLSPDIKLTGGSSGLENADAGTNSVDVRFHRAAGNCVTPGDESVSVQVWLANPSLVMSPHVAGSAALVGFIGSPMPAQAGTQTQHLDFTLPTLTVNPLIPLPDNPKKPGPKCLVALCYPESLIPDPNRFFVPGDSHIAQHNLLVLTTNDTKIKAEVNTLNPDAPSSPLTALPVKLTAVLDLNPSTFVRKVILSRVQTLPGFQRIRNQGLPQGFSFDLTGLQASNVVDHSHGSGPANPSFEVTVDLAFSLRKLKFLAGLEKMQNGDVCIFHLIQGAKGASQGGLTLAVLKT